MCVAQVGSNNIMLHSNNTTTVLQVLERGKKFVYKYDNMIMSHE